MKGAVTIGILAMVAGAAQAQQMGFAVPVQQVPQGQVAQAQPVMVAQAAPTQAVPVQQAPAVTAPQAPVVTQQTQTPVYIVQQPTTTSSAGSAVRIYSQPTTVVEASPLSESRAEQLRRNRVEAEAATERRIVERLEASRIEDEQNRLNRLFGQQAAQQPVANQQVGAQAAAVATPNGAGAIAGAQAGQNGAVATAVVQVPQQPEAAPEKKEEKTTKNYVGLLLGVTDYPGIRNVRPEMAGGFSVGVQNKDRLAFEGFFIYSSLNIEDVTRFGGPFPTYTGGWLTQMDQYNVGGAVKYSLFDGPISPVIGGLASYTYRTFQDEMSFIGSGATATSHAFDIGGLVGLDFRLSEKFYIGGDFRYLMNVTSRSDSRLQQSFAYRPYVTARPIEDLSYYIMSFSARFMF